MDVFEIEVEKEILGVSESRTYILLNIYICIYYTYMYILYYTCNIHILYIYVYRICIYCDTSIL